MFLKIHLLSRKIEQSMVIERHHDHWKGFLIAVCVMSHVCPGGYTKCNRDLDVVGGVGTVLDASSYRL